MQTDNPVLDGFARFLTNAAGAAQSLRSEVETMVKTRIEKLAAELDFVPRDEFEAVKAMASRARAENEQLGVRLKTLEVKVESRQRPALEMKRGRVRPRKAVARKKSGKL